MRAMEVWLHDVHVGDIAENRKGGRFSYTAEVAERLPGVPLLSLCLPVRGRPFREAKTADWFEGLLPEGERRDAICRHLGLSPYDWMGLLAEIGWECAGAVRVFEQGDPRGRTGGYEPLPEESLASKLAGLLTRQPMRSKRRRPSFYARSSSILRWETGTPMPRTSRSCIPGKER